MEMNTTTLMPRSRRLTQTLAEQLVERANRRARETVTRLSRNANYGAYPLRGRAETGLNSDLADLLVGE